MDADAAPAGSAPRTEHLAALGLWGASNALASGKKQAQLLRRIVALNRASPRASLGRSCVPLRQINSKLRTFSMICFLAPIYSDLADTLKTARRQPLDCAQVPACAQCGRGLLLAPARARRRPARTYLYDHDSTRRKINDLRPKITYPVAAPCLAARASRSSRASADRPVAS